MLLIKHIFQWFLPALIDAKTPLTHFFFNYALSVVTKYAPIPPHRKSVVTKYVTHTLSSSSFLLQQCVFIVGLSSRFTLLLVLLLIESFILGSNVSVGC